MKIVRNLFGTLIMFVVLGSKLGFALTVVEILQKMDAIATIGSDVTVKLVMTSIKPEQGARVVEGVYYRRDKDDAYLLIMTAPEVEKGNGYLRVGDDMWMYRRNTRTFQIMTRNQSIAGTEATSENLETRKYSDLYEPAPDQNGQETVTEETLGEAKIPVYRFAVNAKVKDIEYPKSVCWVRQDNFLVLKREHYSLSGTLMKTVYTPKYTAIEGKYVAIREVVVDEFEKGYKTVVELSGISLAPIDNVVFTKGYLENLSK